MGSYRLIKRGVLFSAEGDSITRADLTAEETIEEVVTGSGQPVAVVFGTRYVNPVVVGWAGLGDRLVSYYSRGTGGQTEIRSTPIANRDDNVRMLILSMRMVVCVGPADGVSAFTANGITFYPYTWQSLNDYNHRMYVSVGDADMFSGPDSSLEGGLGFTDQTNSSYQQLSSFLFSTGEQTTTNAVIDSGAQARGVSSLFFHNFNFGGLIPPANWRLAVSRTEKLTHRGKDATEYAPQWNTTGNLHIISDLSIALEKMFYFIVLDPTVDKPDRIRYRDQLLSLPYDDNTRYQISTMSYLQLNTRRATVIGSVVTRSRIEQILNSYINEPLPYAGSTFSTVRAYSWWPTGYTDRILSAYSQSMLRLSLRDHRPLVIWYFNNFVWQQHADLSVNIWYRYMFRAVAQLENQPTIKLVERRYTPFPTVPPSTFQTTVSADTWRLIYSIDATSQPIAYDSTADEYKREFGFFSTFGQSMNPVHALREMLTNPDWGEGIDESRIDNGSFHFGAVTCKNERLDYCAVHDKLGSVSKIVKGVTDYIDGIVYYEAATDKVRLKLIRHDYTLANIPQFDESNMSDISNYQRQHSNETINSVTIKYHDAAKGSAETVTVHDIEASRRVGRVVAATLNYDGCATRQAAVRAAERELTALSKAVISFSCKVNASEVLGLGDAVLVSYRDLDLARIVMRVSKIGYGDGTTGGITLHLIQDVFADLTTFDDIVGDQPIPDESPVLIDLQSNVKFLEAGAVDLSTVRDADGNPIPLSPIGKYLKAGILYDSTVTNQTTVTIAGQQVKVGIGRLLHEIPPLTHDPRTQLFSIYVQAIAYQTSYIRINDEIMSVETYRQISTGIAEYVINRRAQRDTVCPPTSHEIGADVWLLDEAWINNDSWDGVPIVSLVQQGVYTDRELLTPNINFINRHTLPNPPEFVTVNGVYSPNVRVDGDLTIRWDSRTLGADTTIRLVNGNTTIFSHQSSGQSFVIGTDVINLTGQHNLRLYVGSIFNRLNSWQEWEFIIDWSSTTRQRTGWNFRFGFDWGGDDASGWGFDWNKLWGN